MQLAGDRARVPGRGTGFAPAQSGTIVGDHPRELGDPRLDQCPHRSGGHPTRFKHDRRPAPILAGDHQVELVAPRVDQTTRR